MSDPKSPTPPYEVLGTRLKNLRQKVQESLFEASGAVEIEPELLERMEQGYELPSEDILLLLINHFGIQDDEAVRLWELAGYDNEDRDDSKSFHHGSHDGNNASRQQFVMLLAMEMPTVYSNGLEIVSDQAGLIMNFTQTNDQSQTPVAKVGMSYEQAEKVLEALQRTLLHKKYLSGPKALAEQSGFNPKPLPHEDEHKQK